MQKERKEWKFVIFILNEIMEAGYKGQRMLKPGEKLVEDLVIAKNS